MDLELLTEQSKFASLDDLASYVAVNTDVPLSKLARSTGLSQVQVKQLLVNRNFRERVTELMTYSALSPEKERRILMRMIDVATDDGTQFKDFERAASWVYKQGGMLRADKQEVDVSGGIQVSFSLDKAVSQDEIIVDSYVAPDPFAGIVGLRGVSAESVEQANVAFAITSGERSSFDEGEPDYSETFLEDGES